MSTIEPEARKRGTVWPSSEGVGGEGDNGGEKGQGLVKEMCEWPMDMDNSVGIDWGFGDYI